MKTGHGPGQRREVDEGGTHREEQWTLAGGWTVSRETGKVSVLAGPCGRHNGVLALGSWGP